MKKHAVDVKFWAATIILVLVVAFSFAGTVMSRTDFDAEELEGYYREREVQLVKETREYLNERGFLNSGIALTKVIYEDGAREYTLTVHHGDIDDMADSEREALAQELAEFDFADEDSIFYHEFLIND